MNNCTNLEKPHVAELLVLKTVEGAWVAAAAVPTVAVAVAVAVAAALERHTWQNRSTAYCLQPKNLKSPLNTPERQVFSFSFSAVMWAV